MSDELTVPFRSTSATVNCVLLRVACPEIIFDYNYVEVLPKQYNARALYCLVNLGQKTSKL